MSLDNTGARPEGRLLVLLVGLGAVSTTFIAGVEMIRRGLARPVGSLTQLHLVDQERRLHEALCLAPLNDLCFTAWDPIPDSARVAALKAGVLRAEHVEPLAGFLDDINPLPAVFEQASVPQLDGPNVKASETKLKAAEALRQDIRAEIDRHGAARAVMVYCASTEVFAPAKDSHGSREGFEAALEEDDPDITPAQLYAYAALAERVPFINATPNRALDVPAMVELAERDGVAVCGKDLKTGQSLLKAVLAPGLHARMLGVAGWYSLNLLGNRDGMVLNDPDCLRSKEITKTELLADMLDGQAYPELYGELRHSIRIDYYPPRGDAKEGWDNIDLFGWLDYPMQIKVNFLGRDSILAAPLVLDLVLLIDLAQRSGCAGVQDWLGFYFKSPQRRDQPLPNAIHLQHAQLMATLQTWLK